MARINLVSGRYAETTPEQEQAAKDRIAELKSDENFIKRYTHDNPSIREAAIREMTILQGQAYGNDVVIADAFTGTSSK